MNMKLEEEILHFENGLDLVIYEEPLRVELINEKNESVQIGGGEAQRLDETEMFYVIKNVANLDGGTVYVPEDYLVRP